jgi:hypothetical protein
MHRSVVHLAAEAVEGFTHFDGRFWRTLRRLLVNPGKLTRDYIEGRRASEIPPLRLFFVVLLIVFFVGSATHGGEGAFKLEPSAPIQSVLSPGDRKDLSNVKVDFGGGPSKPGAAWLEARAERAAKNPERQAICPLRERAGGPPGRDQARACPARRPGRFRDNLIEAR